MSLRAIKSAPIAFDVNFLQTVLGEDIPAAVHLQALCQEMARLDHHFSPQSDASASCAEFRQLMENNFFWPAPAILLNGAEAHPTLFTSTALGLSDSFDEIFSTLQRTSVLLQNGIQVALDFSSLRAARLAIGAGPWQSVGPVRFMELFERAPQPTGSRTPLRFLLNIDHQDIHDYLSYVATAPAHVRCAISLTREFMTALEKGGRIRLYHKSGGEATSEVAAADLFRGVAKILARGMPLDLLFLDTLREFRMSRRISDEHLLNPHNQLVLPGELVATGALNLASHLQGGTLNETVLQTSFATAIRFLDNCFEKNFYPDDMIRQVTRQQRRLAVSILGIDDVLHSLDPSEHSENRARMVTRLVQLLQSAAVQASHDLGGRRGLENHIFHASHLTPTRHVQVLGQIAIPLLPQIANTPSYLLRREMGLKELREMYPLHVRWQEGLGNIASLRHPLKGLDLTTLTQLVLETHRMGLPVFEMTV